MRVYPAPLEIGDEDGFSEQNDIFGRRPLADGMTNLVSQIEDPMVIALDGAWGSGKTTFLKMWAGELRKKSFPVIFFDAFENDYVDDAFAALVREIIAISESSKSAKTQAAETIKSRAIELGGMLLRGAGRVAINVGVRAATAGVAGPGDFKDLSEQLGSEASDIANHYMEGILNKPNDQENAIKNFRETLSNIPAELQGSDCGESRPLIFIIDELDRCKPIFALSILERIKHFLSVQNVHFILGVNINQLEASVRAIYGADINAQRYLQKFINFTILNVDTSGGLDSRQLYRYAQHLRSALDFEGESEAVVRHATDTIVRVLEHRGATFRSVERAFTVLSIALAFTPKNQLRLAPIIGGLIILKIEYPDLFAKAKHGTLKLEEVLSALFLSNYNENSDNDAEHDARWWTYFLSDSVPDDLREMSRFLWDYAIGDDRKGVVKYHANNVIDRLI